MSFLYIREVSSSSSYTWGYSKPLDDQTQPSPPKRGVGSGNGSERRPPVFQSSLHPCARILPPRLVRFGPVPGSSQELLLQIGGGGHVGSWALAHGRQLGRGGACTFLIPLSLHELVTQTLVWFSSGRACTSLKTCRICLSSLQNKWSLFPQKDVVVIFFRQ